MSSNNLLQLPVELILLILQYLTAPNVASFMKASKTSWQITTRVVDKYPTDRILSRFREAAFASDPEEMFSILPIVRHLHKAGAAIGYEALIISCLSSCSEAVWLLINDGIPYSAVDRVCAAGFTQQNSQRTPLYYAIHNPRPGPLQVTFDFMANEDQSTNNSPGAVCTSAPYPQESLDWAISSKNLAMVEHLLANRQQSGIDVNRPCPQHGVPVLNAAQHGSSYIMSLLLMHGADVRARDPRTGWTAMHYAAANGSSTLIELLHSAGAKIDDVEHRLGHTPLLLAAGHGHHEAVRALRNRGCYRRLVCAEGRSAFEYAVARNSSLSALSPANAMGYAVDESLLGRGPLDYTTLRLFRRNLAHSGDSAAAAAAGGGQGNCTHDRDAEVRKLANLLGCKLSGNKTADTYLVECDERVCGL